MKFHRLEAVRGFAAVYVCLFHLLLGRCQVGSVLLFFRFGVEAVMVFFVLSGFVVYWATIKQDGPIPLRQYLWKRFARIYSVWLPAMLALFAITSIEQHQLARVSVGQLAGNALMLQDYSPVKPAVICDSMFDDIPLWSLHYEWWFYMLFPAVIAGLMTNTRVHVIGIAGVIASIVYALIPNVPCRLLMYFVIWWIGAHAASCLRCRGAVTLADLRWPLIYCVATALPQLVLCWRWHQSGQPLHSTYHPALEPVCLLSAVLFVLLAFLWRRVGWWGFACTVGPFRYVAPISFSLYVIHFKSLAQAYYLSFLHNRAAELAGYIVVTIGFCYLAELVVYPWVRRWNVFGGSRRVQPQAVRREGPKQ